MYLIPVYRAIVGVRPVPAPPPFPSGISDGSILLLAGNQSGYMVRTPPEKTRIKSHYKIVE